MNNINELQNEERILKLQYSQRKHYNNAELLGYLTWFLTIINFVCGSILQLVKIDVNYKVYISGVLVILIFFVQKKFDNDLKIGSSTKEYIDTLLFKLSNNMRFNGLDVEKLMEIAVLTENNNRMDYEIQISHTGIDNPPGVKDWYSDVSGLPERDAVYSCQKENIWWDRKLSKSYLTLAIVIIGISLLMLIIIYSNIGLRTVVYTLFSTLPLFLKASIEVKAYCEYRAYSNQMDALISLNDKKSDIDIDVLVELQNLIFSRRKLRFMPPNRFHRCLTKSLHKLRKSVKTSL